MAKKTEGQTIQWPKRQKDRQYNGQKDRRTNNTMAKKTEGQTNNELQTTSQKMKIKQHETYSKRDMNSGASEG